MNKQTRLATSDYIAEVVQRVQKEFGVKSKYFQSDVSSTYFVLVTEALFKNSKFIEFYWKIEQELKHSFPDEKIVFTYDESLLFPVGKFVPFERNMNNNGSKSF